MSIKKSALTISMLAIIGGSLAYATTLPLNPKIDDFVQKQFNTRAQIKAQVFVILKDQADLSGADALSTRAEKTRYVYDTLRQKAIATQGPLIEFLKTRNVTFRQFYIQNMIAVDNPTAELINTLAKRSDVARIMGNPVTTLKLPARTELKDHAHMTGPEKSLVHMGAVTAWEKYNAQGAGIVVAGQDTGVEWDHPALKQQYRGLSNDGKVTHDYNWHDSIHSPIGDARIKASCGYNTAVPCDDNGHGTHTIGTVVGDDGKGNQVGVAPKAKWMACKNMDRGNGTPASYIECFEFFLAPYPINGNPLTDGDPSKAPHVMNNSWGCTREEGCKGDEILPALKAMKQAGILVVVSAGNEGPACKTIEAPPAWHSALAFTVGAIDHRTDKIARFSSRGPSLFDGGAGPNITAPGVNIRSAVPGHRYESSWSGTSMAGPHVAGAAALLWSFDPKLIGNLKETTKLLEESATGKTTSENCGDVPGTHVPNNTYGHGLLNVAKALCLHSKDCVA